MTILAEGDYGPRSLIEHRLSELGFPTSFVWTWRALGLLSLFLFFLSWDFLVGGCNEETALVKHCA